jgi:hypothetical protein
VLTHASIDALAPLLGAGERRAVASHQISEPTFRPGL